VSTQKCFWDNPTIQFPSPGHYPLLARMKSARMLEAGSTQPPHCGAAIPLCAMALDVLEGSSPHRFLVLRVGRDNGHQIDKPVRSTQITFMIYRTQKSPVNLNQNNLIAELQPKCRATV
jgi:hypothetical protein